MPKKVIFSLVPLFILGGVFAIISSERSPESLVNIPLAEKHRGVCWVGGPDEVFAENLATLADKNVNWISQTPFGWQRGHDNPEIGMNNGKDWVWWGERDLGLKKTTEFAKANGIKTILKPHIWLRDDQGKWRGEIKMKSEEAWQTSERFQDPFLGKAMREGLGHVAALTHVNLEGVVDAKKAEYSC